LREASGNKEGEGGSGGKKRWLCLLQKHTRGEAAHQLHEPEYREKKERKKEERKIKRY
jgi:hypothetical protein